MMMMSDGALSQAEIDALLSGGGGQPAGSGGGVSEADLQALKTFFASTVGAQSSNLSMMTGAEVSLSAPDVAIAGRDAFLGELPETVTAVKVDFTSGFPGEHIFIIPEDGAKTIASLNLKEENIQLDDMAVSVISEAVSQMVGHQITALTDKTGNKSIASLSPESSNVLKTVVALPAEDFVAATYKLNLGERGEIKVWEVLGMQAATDIARSLAGPSQAGKAKPAAGTTPGGSGIGGMNMGGMQGMGGIGMEAGGGGMPFGQANVQSVQFPNLMPHGNGQESGNIGLIMDVYMEMTVELGRTRKLIREILAMGEGTIIELDKLAGEPVDILVNHKLIAKGEVVVIDENFGVRVTEIVSPAERMHGMG